MDLGMWWDEHGETVWATLAALIIAAVFGYYFYRKAEKPKRLGWEILGVNRIISVPDDRRGDLKVVYKDREVQDPNIVIIRVGNSGKREIAAADFDGNLDIVFTDSSLLAFDVIDSSSDLIKPMFSMSSEHPNKLSLKPLLLNAGEWLTLQCVTDGGRKRPKVSARIAGETQIISTVSSGRQSLNARTITALVAPTLALGLLVLSIWAQNANIIGETLAQVAFLGFCFIIIGSVLLDVVFRRMRSKGVWR